MRVQIIVETTNGDVIESVWDDADQQEVEASKELVRDVIVCDAGHISFYVLPDEWTCIPRSSIYAVTVKTQED